MKYVLFYESADDVLSKAPLHIAAHSAQLARFRDRGVLLMGGAYENPQDGALFIFMSREAAEEFAADDPFVRNGVVRTWHIRAWNETQAGP